MRTVKANTMRRFSAAMMLLITTFATALIALGTLKTAYAQTITTIAGTGQAGFPSLGLGIPATSNLTGLTLTGLVVDTGGIFYFTAGNYTTFQNSSIIYKVHPNGAMFALAGAAQGLRGPTGLAIDAANNIYAADLLRNAVWKISPAGVTTRVAGLPDGYTGPPPSSDIRDVPMGGQATATHVPEPLAVAVDTVGNLYILLDRAILKVTAATGVITKFADTCNYIPIASEFNQYVGYGLQAAIATDQQNNVYRVCNYEMTVERFGPNGGAPTRIAGIGGDTVTRSGGDSGDGGPAIYAGFVLPNGIAVDSLGNIFVSTLSRIRKIDTSGVVTTLAGSFSIGFSGDGGLSTKAELKKGGPVALDSAGNVFFADTRNNRIRKITMTVPQPTIGSIEGMNGQLAVRVATPVINNETALRLANPFVSGSGGLPITSYTATCGAQSATSAVTPIIVSGLTNGTTVSCTVRATNGLGQGPLSASMSGTPFQPQIHTIAGTGAAGFSGDGGQASLAQVNQATGVTSDSAGNLYIADLSSNRIRKITPTGVITTIAGTGVAGFSGDGGQASSAQINQPHSVAVDSADNLFIASFGDHRIRRVAATTGVITTVAGTGTAGSAGDGGQATSAQLNLPVSVTVDPQNRLVISERGNHKVRRIDTNGVITTVAGTGVATYSGDNGPATSAGLNSPGAVRADIDYVYIADAGNHRVRRVNASGVISAMAGTGTAGFSGDGGQASSAQFNGPYGLSFHPNGDIYVGTAGDGRIRKITPAGIVSTVAGNGTTIGGANGSVALVGGVTPNMDVWVDLPGNLYFASYNNSVVRKITLVPPAPPTGVVASIGGGFRSLSVSFTPAPAIVGIAVTGYIATCGDQSNTGSVSPIVVSGLAAGVAVTCTVRAVSLAGAGLPSSPSASTATAPLMTQTITFTLLPSMSNRIFGGADAIAATGGASGNAVTFTSASTNVCSTGNMNGSALSFVGAGDCTIHANQAGDDNYAAAPQATTTFSITQALQSITLTAQPSVAARVFGGGGTLVATGGASNNPVVFTSQTTGVCTTSGTNGETVNFVGVGTCNITASQGANTNYAAATPVAISYTIIKTDQTITVGALPFAFVGASSALSATTNAGLAVTFTSLTPLICTVSGTNGINITASQLGECAIAADQAGNANFNAAPQITRTLSVYLPAVWNAAASLQSARLFHTMTRLNDGRVLLTGGNTVASGSGSSVIGSAEIYDPSANTWTAVGNLSSARQLHTATLLNTGKVLIAGGRGASASLSNAELFDPATNTFTAAGTAAARDSHQAVLLADGRVMIIGGINGNGCCESDKVDIYNPITNTWTAAANLPATRTNFMASRLPNGNVLVAGGIISAAATASSIVYNPTTNMWSTTASLATERISPGVTLLNGQFLVAGGFASGNVLAQTERYDSVANAWSSAGSLSVARVMPLALLANGMALAAAGEGMSSTRLASSELYNPSSNTWSFTSNLNTARMLHTAITLNDGRVLAAGGVTVGSTAINSAEIYVPIRFNITPTPTLSNGAFAQAYPATTFSAEGGLAPYAFSVAYGALPTGLSLSAAGVLSGTPSASGVYNFSVVAIDANGQSSVRAYSLNVPATTQTISFGGAPTINLQVSATTTVTATGGLSGNPVVFSVLSGNCTSTGTNGATISGLGQGNCVIAANQAGNSQYSGAPQVTQTVEVVTLPDVPTMVVATRGNTQVSVSFTLPARNGNRPITGYIATCGSQSVSGSGSPIVVTPLANGIPVTCTVGAVNAIGTATSAASNAATPASVPDAPIIGIATAGSASVSVVFTAPASNGGAAITSYTATCGALSATGAASPITVTGVVNGVAVNCVVTATNSVGLSNPSSASSSITPTAIAQSISFTATPTLSVGATRSLGATGGASGLPIVFTSATTSTCTVSGNTVTGVASGNCTINANQAGNTIYGAASQVSLSFNVGLGSQTITFGAAPTLGNGQSATIIATGGATGNPIVFANTTPGVCTLTGSVVTAGYAGTCTITANQAGNASYQAAPEATLSITIVAETWRITGAMAVSRTAGHTLTRLNDGRVLVLGGDSGDPRSFNGNPLSSAELYNPTTGTWTAAASMPGPRTDHTATLLADGTVLVTGGRENYNFGENLKSMIRYHPQTDTWSAAGTLAIDRYEHTATLLANGNVLIAFGTSLVTNSYNTTEIVDPVANIANARVNGPSRNDIVMTRQSATRLANGDVLFVGGDGSGCDAVLYRAATNTLALPPRFSNSECRSLHSASLLGDNRVLISGGATIDLNSGGLNFDFSRYNSNYWNTTYAYTPSSNTWQGQANMGSTRAAHTANLLSSGKVLVAGGLDMGRNYLDSAILYDPVANTWTPTARLNIARQEAKSVLLNDGRVLVTGGRGNPTAELYDDGTALPGAPAIGAASAGNASATVSFTAPSGQGVTSVTAISSPGGISATCNLPCSSITVNGLTNGTVYTFTVTATNINGTGFASAASNSVTPMPATSTFTVTSSTGANGAISPNTAQTINSGSTAIFSVIASSGYLASVGGTCGGTLVGNTYTTNAVSANCTVIASFTLNLALNAVQSRKTHGAAGTFDLLIDTVPLIAGSVTVEPRIIGTGHSIVFQFNQAVTAIGSVTAVDTNGNSIGTANGVINSGNNSEVIVTLTGVADANRITVSINNVAGANNTLNRATASIGFLVGDVNNSRSISNTDITAIKTRAGQPLDNTNFKFDVNASGGITNTDITATKARVGLGI